MMMTSSRPIATSWLIPIALALALACGREEPSDKGVASSRPPPGVPAKPGAEHTPFEASVVPKEPGSPEETATIMVTNLDTPESVLHDAEADVYYVANIAGEPKDKDDNGFISKVSPEGKMLAHKWIEGAKDGVDLDAPKGMGIFGDILYVADIDRVRKFDRRTGKPSGEIPIRGAMFLADIAVDEHGVVYVSDMGLMPTTPPTGATKDEARMGPVGAGAIHRIENDAPALLAQGEALAGPNGLAVSSAGLWVVTHRGKALMRIAEDGTPAETTELPAGQLDGLVITDDGQFVVSSWEAGAIFAGKPGGTFTAIFEGIEAPADLGYDAKRQRLLVPRFHADVIELRPLKAALDKHAAR